MQLATALAGFVAVCSLCHDPGLIGRTSLVMITCQARCCVRRQFRAPFRPTLGVMAEKNAMPWKRPRMEAACSLRRDVTSQVRCQPCSTLPYEVSRLPF